MNALVLGGTGFLGHAIAVQLGSNGYAVRTLSRQVRAQPADKAIEFFQGDVRDIENIRPHLTWADYVFYFASSSVPNYNTTPTFEAGQELIPLLAVLDELKIANKKFVYCSSGGAVYGQADEFPIHEEQMRKPITSYGMIKAAAEDFIRYYGLPHLILRPANIYGPKLNTLGKQGFISTIVFNALRGYTSTIWVPLNIKKDYLYIDDFAQLVMGLLQQNAEGIYNIGSGVPHTLDELIRQVEITTGKKVNYSQPATLQPDVSFVLSTKKLSGVTGSHQSLSLQEGIAKIVQSFHGLTLK